MGWQLQAKNNAPIILDFQIFDSLHMKFDKIEAVGKPQVERKKLKKTQLHWDRF